MWKVIRQQHRSKKVKAVAPTWNNEFELPVAPRWNNEFELPDGSYSVSDTQDYIEYIIKKHETLPTNFPINIYINRINNRLVFKKQ